MRFGKNNTTSASSVAPLAEPQESASERKNVNYEESALEAPQETVDTITKEIYARLNMDTAVQMPHAQLQEEVEDAVAQIAEEKRLQVNAKEQHLIAGQITNEMHGVGPLQTLLDDDRVTDIMVNGPYSVFIEERGKLVKTPVKFRDEDHLKRLAQRMARNVGRRLDDSSPMVDARLPDGSRVNIVMPPISLQGTLISIRRFPNKPITLDFLSQNGTIDKGIRTFLEVASRGRLNMVISGGTGSGKTTLLNACSQYIDPQERIVTIEDAAELRLQQPHVLSLETRPASLEGAHEIGQRELVKNALRMRPDRIILGEVRQGEAFDMLQAMNTGHDGSLGTMHANNPRDAVARLENMIMMAGFDLPARAIRNQISSALDLIVQIQRMPDGQRRLTNIVEVVGIENDTITLQELFSYNVEDNKGGRLQGHFQIHNTTPRCIDKVAAHGLSGVMKSIFQGQV